MQSLCVFAVLVAVAVASEHDQYKDNKGVHDTAKYGYHGKFPGKCGNDGFYLNDPYSFVICSNGNAYVQPCAPGTRNNPGRYNHGAYYSQNDFCNENLNDYGYAAHAPRHAPAYGHFPYYGYPGFGYPGYYW